MRKYLAGLSVLLLIATSMAQYVSVARTKTGGGTSSVTPAAICSATASGSTVSCSATGTPTSGGKIVIIYVTNATVGTGNPTSSNTTCSNNGTANSYTFEAGNTSNNMISVWDATLTNVASGMTFTCSTTQTGRQFGNNLMVVNAVGSTGIDTSATGGGFVFNTGASSASAWTSSTMTPSQTGEGIIAGIANTNASGSLSYTVNNSFSLGTVADASDANVGPTVAAFRGPYASVTGLSVTFTAASGGATDTPNMVILAYK